MKRGGHTIVSGFQNERSNWHPIPESTACPRHVARQARRHAVLSGMRVNFLLPGSGHVPVGGVKVAYEYANALARRGCSVSMVHGASVYFDTPLSLRHRAGYIYRRIAGNYRPGSWFNAEPAVRILWRPSLAPRYVPAADVVIATAWPTAEWASRYPAEKGKRFYLIQHWENWNGHEDRLRATWKAPLKKIVIARWLRQIATSLGEEAAYIPNGLDFSRFFLSVPISQRDPLSIAMLYHNSDWKGSKDGIQALCMIRDQFPDLRLSLFGVVRRPADLPDWIQYHCRPTQEVLRDIYNSAAIFVSPSWAEGWPLPPAEAMMCGAALVATDIGGHQEYVVHEKTGLLSPAKHPELLARSILRLIQNPVLRMQLAAEGNSYIQQFTWERAADAFETVLSPRSFN